MSDPYAAFAAATPGLTPRERTDKIDAVNDAFRLLLTDRTSIARRRNLVVAWKALHAGSGWMDPDNWEDKICVFEAINFHMDRMTPREAVIQAVLYVHLD